MNWPWSVTAKGFAMGVADLVPGVSGGTVAFIAGIYDPLLDSLSSLSGEGLTALRKGKLLEAWNAVNGSFLVALAVGIVTAIATLASPLHWLLEHHPVMLRAFFVGLVATSVPLVGKHVKPWGLDTWVWAALGCAVAGFVTSIPPLVQTDHPALLILGAYAPVLLAVKTLDLTKMGAFGAGAVLGLLLFSRALKWLLSARRRPTLALLTGFLVVSLQALWPWKAQVRPLYTHSDGRVEWLLENIAPQGNIAAALGLACLGGGVVWGLHRRGNTRGKNEVG